MVSALLLAGARAENCPLCLNAQVPSKALVPLGGVRMIDHVLRSLRDAPELCGDIWISGLDRQTLIKDAPDDLLPFLNRIRYAPPGICPSDAALAAIDAGATAPLMVTTCDHPLLTPTMIGHFIRGANAQACDFAVALATRSTIQSAYPETRRTYLPLGEEHYSGCNMFLLRNPAGRKAVAFWQQIGQDRKKPWKIARHFSLGTAYKMLRGTLDLDTAFAFGSARISANVAPVIIPIAEAAIDVDKPADLTLVSSILARTDKAA